MQVLNPSSRKQKMKNENNFLVWGEKRVKPVLELSRNLLLNEKLVLMT